MGCLHQKLVVLEWALAVEAVGEAAEVGAVVCVHCFSPIRLFRGAPLRCRIHRCG
jgi:hypothetical protein